MSNSVILIGRITSTPEVQENIDNKSYCIINLAIQRSYKNDEGVYETDYIPVRLEGTIATNTAEYCKQGDLVGVKGALHQTIDGRLQVYAERITFLASKKLDEISEK